MSTTKTAQHTPVPWAFKKVPVWAPTTPTDGIPVFEFCFTGGDEWMNRAKANARFICLAVNCHAELLAACKCFMREWDDTLKDDFKDSSLETVADLCRSAIGRAEGKS